MYSENLSFIGNNAECFFEHSFGDITGTLVVMEIMKNSTKNTADVFNEYTDPDRQPAFFKTIIPVRLMQSEGVELMSRSQAKRLITRFERFTEVVLDFTGVDFIGQGFSDEIFRVFANAYPDTQLVPINCQREVQNMIDLAFNKYISRATDGTVAFDYSNNNGRYRIGHDTLSFELSFSKASNSSIYMLNDPPSIDTIAIAKDITEIRQIKEAHIYDGSSRIRCPEVNQVVVLQNSNGFYAAVKILSIKDDTRDGAKNDEVVFEYVIQTNGSPDFTQ